MEKNIIAYISLNVKAFVTHFQKAWTEVYVEVYTLLEVYVDICKKQH